MRRLVAVLLVAVAAGLLTGCGGRGALTATARFADIGDLAPGAPVMMSDIQVGKVTGISLQGYRAVVTMSIQRSAMVPREVTARVRRTSLLGERIVDLVPAPNLPSNAPLLADGATIART